MSHEFTSLTLSCMFHSDKMKLKLFLEQIIAWRFDNYLLIFTKSYLLIPKDFIHVLKIIIYHIRNMSRHLFSKKDRKRWKLLMLIFCFPVFVMTIIHHTKSRTDCYQTLTSHNNPPMSLVNNQAPHFAVKHAAAAACRYQTSLHSFNVR